MPWSWWWWWGAGAARIVGGPFRIEESQAYTAGPVSASSYKAGPVVTQEYTAGAVAGQGVCDEID